MRNRCKYLDVGKGLLLVIVALIYFKDLQVVNGRSIYVWDEAIYANNAMEMARNNNYWVYTVGDTVDHHNTKPPLVLWGQALSIKAFGYNELSVRIPTFLALLATIILLVVYGKRLSGSTTPGLLSAIFLLTNYGAIRNHVFLSGDLDGVLVMFTTWIMLHFLQCLKKQGFDNRDYLLFAILFCCGFLTKSTAILLIIPALLFCLLVTNGKLARTVLLNKQCAMAVLAFVIIVISYYFLREAADTGYWKVVWYSEFKRLTTDVQEWLHYPWDQYFQNFYHVFFRAYFVLLLLVLIPYVLVKEVRNKCWVLQILAGSLVYLLTITIPETKLEWYDAPIYPLLCAALGVIIYELGSASMMYSKHTRILITMSLLLLGVFVWERYKELHEKLYVLSTTYLRDEILSNGIRDFYKKYPAQNKLYVVFPFVDNKHMHALDALAFYKKCYFINSNKHTELTSDILELQKGDTILIANTGMIDTLKQTFDVVPLDTLPQCKLVTLKAR